MYALFEQARMGPMTLRNRTVRSATNEHLSDLTGEFTEAWAAAEEELARGGVGLIITGHVTVDRGRRSDAGQPALDDKTDLSLLKRAVQAVHDQGARIVMQLSHPGLKQRDEASAKPRQGPGDFSPEELDELAARYVHAAKLARQAGFDGVQIHNAHGYLLATFMDPATNPRTDAYGGPMENRFRLTGRIIRAVREACGGDFAILAKADCNSTDDFPALARLYQDAGADALEISGKEVAAHTGERKAFYLDYALAARERTRLPLILVGGIFSRSEAERVLRAGVPFVSFCRALICQPDFISRMEHGEEESGCLACNNCYRVYRSRPVRCVLHTEPIPRLAENFGTGEAGAKI